LREAASLRRTQAEAWLSSLRDQVGGR
jgi:hypothetical protein